MKGDFRAAAEAHAEGRDHDGLERELDGLRHVLELTDGHVNFVPLLFLHPHQQHHDVGADGEVSGIVGDDEGVERVACAAGLQRLGDERDDVAAERVHLGVELDAADAVAEIDERSACVLLDHSVGFLGDGDGPDSGGNFFSLVVAVATSKYLRPLAVLGSSAYQVVLPDASNFSTLAATGRPSFFMRSTVWATPAASHSSNGPISQLKPVFIALSISTMESAISGTRLAE